MNPWSHDPRVRYAISVLLDQPECCAPNAAGAPEWLVYGPPEELPAGRGICIVPSGFFQRDYGLPHSLPNLPLRSIEGMPFLYGEPSIERTGDWLVVRADLVASAYFLLSRYEEWLRKDVRDEHGRFPGKQSLPFRAGFIERPVVDEYCAALRCWARSLGIAVADPARRFSVLLTCDFDYIGSTLRMLQPVRCLVSALLGRQSWKQARKIAGYSLGLLPDPLDNVDDVVRLHGEFVSRVGPDRAASVCFFLAGRRCPLDGNYDIDNPEIVERLRRARAAGSEIGIHASYLAGSRPELFAPERALLEKIVGPPIEKNRNHYLRWCEPEDGQAIAEAGITWDSTLGYADVAGFRLGVCRPVPLFDPSRRCLLGIKEHPLTVMDCTLSAAKYMGLSEDEALACVCRLAEATRRHEGELVLLWHNTLLADLDETYHPALYRRILDHLAGLCSQA